MLKNPCPSALRSFAENRDAEDIGLTHDEIVRYSRHLLLPGIVGVIQATETIKQIVGGAKPLVGRLLAFDAWQMSFRMLNLEKDPGCPVCGENPTIHELIDECLAPAP